MPTIILPLDRLGIRAGVRGGKKEESLAQREQAKDHHDQVNPRAEERIAKRVTLRIRHRIKAHGLQKYAEHRQHTCRKNLPSVGEDYEDDTKECGEEYLARAEHWCNECQDR